MKSRYMLAASIVAMLSFVGGCVQRPVAHSEVPRADDARSYIPQAQQKPLPAEATGQQPVVTAQAGPYGAQAQAPGAAAQAGPYGAQAQAGQVPQAPAAPQLQLGDTELAYVNAYTQRRMPRMMVFVNRTFDGTVLPKDQLEERIRIEQKQSSTGAVKVANDNSVSGTENKAVAGAGYSGSISGASNTVVQKNDKSSFESTGPAEYTKTSSIKVAPSKLDELGATRDDYEMIELSMVDYMDANGKVYVKDSEAARAKLDREKILRIENSDPAAIRLLNTELQTDILIQIKATPTKQSQWGDKAVRLNAKATSVTDGRYLGAAFVDMPVPMTKTNINVFTRYLAGKMMEQLTTKWTSGALFDMVEVRVYKAATVDDSLKIRKFIQGIPGVQSVVSRGATGSSATSYSTFQVAYGYAPEDLYAALKDAIGQSQGLKAVDLQSNTITLEVTGPMNLVTTSTKTETKTTVETKTTETKTVDPIQPAQQPQVPETPKSSAAPQ